MSDCWTHKRSRLGPVKTFYIKYQVKSIFKIQQYIWKFKHHIYGFKNSPWVGYDKVQSEVQSFGDNVSMYHPVLSCYNHRKLCGILLSHGDRKNFMVPFYG